MVNKSANDTDRSSAGEGAAVGAEQDGGTDESQATPMIGCPDPNNCTKPGFSLTSTSEQAA
jgi:hypothetical protein